MKIRQSSHSSRSSQTTRSRLVVAVIAALSLLATSGLVAPEATAQGSTEFVFQGAGWGHGVGMSQNGARNAANGGLDHVGILNHYYPNTIVSQVGPLDNIRVHIGDAARVELSSDGSILFEKGGVAINSIAAGSITVSAHDGGLQIGNAWTTGSASDPLMVSFPQPIKVANNGHRYLWGKLQLTVKDGKVRVVEILPLEDYVAGIAEMPAAWPLEALMAQAIAARTYAHEVTLHRRASLEWAQEYDISGTTVDQNYIGYDAQDSAWDQKWLAAVKATAGIEIVDSNGPIRAYYSASNGGYTETADYVFSNNVPYTVAGPDPYDAGGHDWTNWTRTYSQESMSRWLNAHADTAVGTVTAINVLGGAGASARIDKAVVEIVGTSGTKRVTGKRLMLVINAGVFGEGGGLSTHLPGTFTTVGNGVGAGAPQPTGAPVPTTVTPDPVADEAISENTDFTPPPGWQPEPGTGVAPRTGGAVATAADSGAASAEESLVDDAAQPGDDGEFTPPEDWVPEPGTGVPPRSDGAVASTADDSPIDDAAQPDDGSGFTPPEGWVPDPGTGVPPRSAEGALVGGIGGGDATADADETKATAEATTTSETIETTPAPALASSTSVVAAPDAGFTPPEGWVPEPGTGVPPRGASRSLVGGIGGGDAQASGVFLVTRTADAAAITETNFEVIAPTADLAEEARSRLNELQEKAALGLFADIDVDGYVASVAPRPVHGICTADEDGVTCVPLEALQDDD